MKKSSVLCLLLTMILVIGLLCGCSNSDEGAVSAPTDDLNTPSPTYDDAELAYALELGIGHYQEVDATITYAEFVEMLDRKKGHPYFQCVRDKHRK